MLIDKIADQVADAENRERYAARLIAKLGNPSEWAYTGIVDEAVDAKCACGHPIRFRFHIEHPTRGAAVVGSTCIDHLAGISPELGAKLLAAREAHEQALLAAEARAARAAADAENAALWGQYCEARDKAFAMHKANREIRRMSPHDLWYFCCGNNEPFRRSNPPQYTRPSDLRKWLKKAIDRARIATECA